MPIRSVTNITGHTLLFINTESSRDNREILTNSTRDVGGAWVPWARTAAEFPGHHFQIINADNEQILWYIWQRRAGDGDFIRASHVGFVDPGPHIAGDAGTSGDRNLFITANSLTANVP